jgi:predicted nucleic acid-binding protein
VRRYLLDTGVLLPFSKGRAGAVALVTPWLSQQEATTSLLVYGEIIEYLKSQPDFTRRRGDLRLLIRRQIPAYGLTYTILERYTDLRRALRPPHGPGLIGDIDTLIAATALEYHLTLVTADSDYLRVPGLTVRHVASSALR